jgi:hypothetical protein
LELEEKRGCRIHVPGLRPGLIIALLWSWEEKSGNAFQKKSQKTPRQEIEKALKIMEEYNNDESRK